MKNLCSSFTVTILGCFLIFGYTHDLSGKQTGFYVHGGVTYWDGLEAPDVDTVEELGNLQFNFDLADSRTNFSLGAGYNFNTKWGFEAFYTQTPEGVLEFVDPESTITDSDDPVSLSISTRIQHTVFGINTVYDFYVNRRFSLFGKLGVSFLQADTDLTTISIDGETLSFRSQDSPVQGEDEDTQELFGAIGARIPLWSSDASVTFAYQFVGLSDDRETNFEVGFQWQF